jgi:hypothetical protein
MKGLTIFEVLIAVLIFSVIALGLGYTVVAGKSALLASDVPTQLRQNVVFAIMSISRDLRQADSAHITIVNSAPCNSITFRIPQDNNADGLVIDSAGDIEWSQYITYTCNGADQLLRTVDGVSSVIAPNITALGFSWLTEDALLQIDITAQKKDAGGHLSLDAQGNAYEDTERSVVRIRNRE